MSLKQYIALVSVTMALSAGAYFSEKSFLASRDIPAAVQEIPIAALSTTSKLSEIPETPSAKPATEKPQPTPNVTFSVGSTTYAVYVPQNSSVLDAMQVLASTTSFTFSGRDYTSLGFFVESVNGRAAANGSVWIFYVNGVKSGKGISSVAITPGDTIEWKYERSY